MKFGKYLESVREGSWHNQYIDYDKIKAQLKIVVREWIRVFRGHVEAMADSSPPTPSLKRQSSQQVLDSLSQIQAEKDFFALLLLERDKVTTFYTRKVKELQEQVSSIPIDDIPVESLASWKENVHLLWTLLYLSLIHI